MLTIKIDDRQFKAMAKKLMKLTTDAPKLIANSINQGLDEGMPFAASTISSIYNIGGVEGQLAVHKASAGSLKGDITGTGGMLPVSQFSPDVSVTTGSRGRPAQTITVEIKRGSRKPIMPSAMGRGAFMIGDGRIMERRQHERFPIYPVSTIGIPQMLGSKAVSIPVQDKIGEVALNKLEGYIMAL